jgi:CO/xanthine dehydrogenase FAD-binding subunit
VGGSVAQADPKAELPVALAALDARFHVRSPRRSRTLGAGELFAGALMTTLEPDELLTEIEVPPLPARAGSVFVEHARTHGDFAVAGAAVVVAPAHAAIALLGPLRARDAEAALRGGASAREAAALAGAEVAEGHTRALTTELVRRAIERARA